ncbi:MAG: SAM-dependent methyltransferase [Acidobacteria bacterium]|jgi:precorrin-6B methylase 2|nr:SAM-dependent methyltransferase [Acidobacteriota bacterium]
MKAMGAVRSSTVLFFLAMLVAGSGAPAQQAQQAQQTKQFQPEVGQAGKDVVWVPTPQALVDKMLDMAKLTPQDFLVDLGSGDGRTVITAAKRGARALGIEFNPDMVELSIASALKEGVSERAKFMKADIFESDFTQATVVTMFLLPGINMKLRPKLLDMKPGTRIVTNSFTMEDWQADESATVEDGCTTWCTAYLWIVPAKVAGTWKLASGELVLNQEFQSLGGTFTSNGKSMTVSDAKMRGDQITFTAGGAAYTGRVKGDRMDGTVSINGKAVPWSAARAVK